MELINYLEKNKISFTKTKKGISVSGSLYLRGTQITSLPDNLSVGSYLCLENTQITSLPDNLSVGGYLYLEGTQITSIPDNLKSNTRVKIKNKGKWIVKITKESIIIGCQKRSKTEWEYFFNNNNYTETNPNTHPKNYDLIKQDFKRAIKIQNKLFK